MKGVGSGFWVCGFEYKAQGNRKHECASSHHGSWVPIGDKGAFDGGT